MSLASQSRRRSRIRSVGGCDLRDRLSLGQLLGRRLEDLHQLLDRDRDVHEEIARLQGEAVAQRGEILLEDLRREDLARAVGQVVRLVDQQDRFLQVLARQVPQRGGGLEDVVVVGDDRVGARGDLELHLERADLLAPGLLEHGVGVEVRVAVAQPPEQVRALHLVRVVLGEPAEILVAEDLVVGAHALLGADLDRLERPLVHRDERGDGHLLLQRLGRQEDDLAPGGEALGEGGVERGRGLARARRRLGDEVLAGGHGVADRVDQLLLDGARGGVGEGQPGGGRGLALPRDLHVAPDRERPGQAPLDLVLDLVVEGHVERQLGAGLDVHVNEGAVDVAAVPEPAPEVAVAEQLPPVPLERVSGGPDPVDREVGRLELLDQPLARRALDAAVEPARQDGGPVLDRQARLEVDLGAVRGMEVSSLVEDTGVDLRPEAEPAPAVAAVETDAAEPLVLRQLANGDFKYAVGFVKSQEGVDYNLRVSRVLPNRTRISVLVALIALLLAPAAQASKPRKRRRAADPAAGARPGGPPRPGAFGRRLRRDRGPRDRRGRLCPQSRPGRDDRVRHEDAFVGRGAALPRPDVQVPHDLLAARRGARRQPRRIAAGRRRGRPQHFRSFLRERLVRRVRPLGGRAQAGRDRARLGRPDPERERVRRHLPPPRLAARPRHALVPGAHLRAFVQRQRRDRLRRPRRAARRSGDRLDRPGHRHRPERSARANGRQDRQGARRRGAARRLGPGVRGRDRPGAILPLLGAARDRRPAEVLRRRAEEPAARRGHRAHGFRRGEGGQAGQRVGPRLRRPSRT